MAYSHIKLTGGAGDGKTIRNTITQTDHGFTIGQAIRYNIASATGIPTDKYSPAEASGGADKAEVVGIVDDIFGDNEFSLTYAGEINTAVFGDPFILETGPDVFFYLRDLLRGNLQVQHQLVPERSSNLSWSKLMGIERYLQIISDLSLVVNLQFHSIKCNQLQRFNLSLPRQQI